MFKICAFVCLLFIVTSYAKVTPSPDFNITNFVGNWNVVGFFSTLDLGVKFYSCGTLNVTLGTLSRLTLSINYLTTITGEYVQKSNTFVPSPLSKATLISTTTPSADNNMIVTFYDADNGEAILINPAQTFGLVLAKSDNPYFNNLQTTASQLFTSLGLSLNNLTLIFNKDCELNGLNALSNFDPSSVAGQFYGNAFYSTASDPSDVQCFSLRFESLGSLYNVTNNFTSTSGKIIYSSFNYLPFPGKTSVFVNTQIRNIAPNVFIYADTGSSTFVAATGDSTSAVVFSTQPTLSQDLLSQVMQVLNRNGFLISSTNFVVMNSTCQLNDGMQEILY